MENRLAERKLRHSPVFTIPVVNTIGKLGLPARTFDAEELRRKYPHLKNMKAKSMVNAHPRMVIGMTELDLMVGREILETKNRDDPIAVRCKLGWYIGERKAAWEKSFHAIISKDDELHQLVKQFFTTESFGVKVYADSSRSLEDKRAMKILDRTTKKSGSRWETGLLWKSDDPILPASKAMALQRLQTMERKMDKSEEFAKLCEEKFNDYIAKGYLVPSNNHVIGNDRRWYLPWFFAYHPTKKPRLVFDAAAKSNGKTGVCLNDFLLKGPDLLRPLAAVLMRFRIHRIAITGDIREMFHQVLLKEDDRKSQTILYRGKQRDIPPVEYQMQVLFFGSASSPCSSIFTKDRNAEQFEDVMPAAVKAIKLDHYVDDYLGGADSEEDAVLLRQQVTQTHAAGGFTIAKWSSNSKTVVETIPLELRAHGVTTFNEKTDIMVEKTLGLLWDPEEDVFRFHLNFRKVPEDVKTGRRMPTKREMASLIMSLYDPLGFLGPFKIRALSILQQTWRLGTSWDDEIPQSVAACWVEWLKELPSIEKIQIPRCYSDVLKTADSIQLHTFCDASEEAFSAVVFLRIQKNSTVKVAFIAGKTRVAPIKFLTIPRLELQAAVMGSRLANAVKQAFQDDVRIDSCYYWSDSITVLRRLRSISSRYNQFVANRISEVQELTEVVQWRWVPTRENVADDATRATKAIELKSDSRWLKGPKFLFGPETSWPVEIKEEADAPEVDLEMKVVATATRVEDAFPLPDITRFSSWMRLIRATATVLAAGRKFMGGDAIVTVKDMESAELLWNKKSQSESFEKDIFQLQRNDKVEKNSSLYRLSPALDNSGVIVLRGRISAAEVNDAVKKPAILHGKHRYTELLISWYHKKNGHYGQEAVLNQLRQKVWIIDGRSAVRRCWINCLECKYRRSRPVIPEMGQLPVARLGDVHQPFFHTGVDYFGPLQVTVNRRVQKRWGVLFTCMSTRAVHLEIAEQLDTSEMINAYVRFASVRGAPSHLWSDNGTNFVGAEREMKEALADWNQKVIQDELAVRGVQWHFNPPSAPHMGGSWERLIGSVKRILGRILKCQAPRESVLRTLLCEAMEILNNRPLTHVSIDPADQECVTPNHLLRVKGVFAPTIPGVFGDGERYRKSWKYTQYLAEQFWRRWMVEYLPTLAKREKWHGAVNPIKVGDLVLVINDQIPRSTWRKGIITATFPAKDGQIRIVDVKVASVNVEKSSKGITFTTYRRPVAKLIPLGVSAVTGGTGEGGMSSPEPPTTK